MTASLKKAQKLRDLGVVRATHMQLLESNLKISSFMEYLPNKNFALGHQS